MIRRWFGKSAGRLSAGVLILLLNSAYLAAFAEPTLFYFANVVAHIGLGSVLATVFARLLIAHRRGVPSALLAASVLGAAGVLFGVAITIVGAAGRTRWMLPLHIALMLAGIIPWLVYAAWFAAWRLALRQRLALGVA